MDLILKTEKGGSKRGCLLGLKVISTRRSVLQRSYKEMTKFRDQKDAIPLHEFITTEMIDFELFYSLPQL